MNTSAEGCTMGKLTEKLTATVYKEAPGSYVVILTTSKPFGKLKTLGFTKVSKTIFSKECNLKELKELKKALPEVKFIHENIES